MSPYRGYGTPPSRRADRRLYFWSFWGLVVLVVTLPLILLEPCWFFRPVKKNNAYQHSELKELEVIIGTAALSLMLVLQWVLIVAAAVQGGVRFHHGFLRFNREWEAA